MAVKIRFMTLVYAILRAMRRISIAPMMDCTDRHFRRLMRSITQNTLLYTEMITTGAVIHGDRERLLGYNDIEHPVALQLGGSDPKALAHSSQIAEDWSYDEVNLNVGCPSDRVQSGRFGACLMKEPELVADCIAAMKAAVNIPVTVKTRIGVDDQDSYALLCRFIEIVKAAGCESFTLHARKAWLKGLSPKENRNIPPLHYDRVYQLKTDFPELEININGGIKTIAAMQEHLQYVDGVMLGREAYSNPYLMVQVDGLFFDAKESMPSQHEVVLDYLPYVIEQFSQGVPLRRLTRHLVGLFQGMPGARAWRRYLSENSGRGSTPAIIEQGLEFVKGVEDAIDSHVRRDLSTEKSNPQCFSSS